MKPRARRLVIGAACAALVIAGLCFAYARRPKTVDLQGRAVTDPGEYEMTINRAREWLRVLAEEGIATEGTAAGQPVGVSRSEKYGVGDQIYSLRWSPGTTIEMRPDGALRHFWNGAEQVRREALFQRMNGADARAVLPALSEWVTTESLHLASVRLLKRLNASTWQEYELRGVYADARRSFERGTLNMVPTASFSFIGKENGIYSWGKVAHFEYQFIGGGLLYLENMSIAADCPTLGDMKIDLLGAEEIAKRFLEKKVYETEISCVFPCRMTVICFPQVRKGNSQWTEDYTRPRLGHFLHSFSGSEAGKEFMQDQIVVDAVDGAILNWEVVRLIGPGPQDIDCSEFGFVGLAEPDR